MGTVTSEILSIDGYVYKGCGQFAERLTAAMKLRKMNKQQVAHAAFVERCTIGSYAAGRTIPNIDIGYRIAYVLKVDPMWLYGYKEKG